MSDIARNLDLADEVLREGDRTALISRADKLVPELQKLVEETRTQVLAVQAFVKECDTAICEYKIFSNSGKDVFANPGWQKYIFKESPYLEKPPSVIESAFLRRGKILSRFMDEIEAIKEETSRMTPGGVQHELFIPYLEERVGRVLEILEEIRRYAEICLGEVLCDSNRGERSLARISKATSGAPLDTPVETEIEVTSSADVALIFESDRKILHLRERRNTAKKSVIAIEAFIENYDKTIRRIQEDVSTFPASLDSQPTFAGGFDWHRWYYEIFWDHLPSNMAGLSDVDQKAFGNFWLESREALKPIALLINRRSTLTNKHSELTIKHIKANTTVSRNLMSNNILSEKIAELQAELEDLDKRFCLVRLFSRKQRCKGHQEEYDEKSKAIADARSQIKGYRAEIVKIEDEVKSEKSEIESEELLWKEQAIDLIPPALSVKCCYCEKIKQWAEGRLPELQQKLREAQEALDQALANRPDKEPV